MDKIYIVMPAYNEADNIRETIGKWYQILDGKHPESKLVIADSGSTDDTHKICMDLQNSFPKLLILSDTNKYHGPKLIALYKKAIADGADYIFQTDSDGQTDPNEFNKFWMLREDFDVVLGYRHQRGDGKSRAFVEQVVCLLIRIIFGVSAPDANAPFRLMKTKVVQRYISRFSNDYNLPNIMLTTFFLYYKEKITFAKISFKPRQAGVNSINIPRIIKIGFFALFDFIKFRWKM